MAFDWLEFLLATVSAVLVSSGILFFIFKTIFEGWVKQKVELDLAKAKGEIQAKLDYKATKFKYVYERKIIVLRDVCEKLWMLEQAVAQYVSLWGEVVSDQRTETGQACVECWKELNNCFEPNRMFFSEELAKKIASLRDRCIDAVTTFAVFVHRADEGIDRQTPGKDSTEKWIEVNSFITKESPAIRREIEQELRQEFDN
ncbi:MAG: hypothetical protein NPIRA06_31320 [Nitrospirales bacterium]|nr:MAG: hypothetical protein NPIRA06_31320 [Nitrospirales bacterium]